MEIEVVGPDQFGNGAYKKLFDDIIGDIGKSFMIKEAKLILKPEVPLFIYSVMLKSEPVNRTIFDVASLRPEGNEIHLSISNERYAPEILSQLWKKYGRSRVKQQTRFDLVIHDADESEVEKIVVASGEESVKEILGAFWRAMPEGIRVRDTFVDGRIVTVMAMEEIIRKECVDEALAVHREMIERGKVQ